MRYAHRTRIHRWMTIQKYTLRRVLYRYVSMQYYFLHKRVMSRLSTKYPQKAATSILVSPDELITEGDERHLDLLTKMMFSESLRSTVAISNEFFKTMVDVNNLHLVVDKL
jgi:hypothetical protein